MADRVWTHKELQDICFKVDPGLEEDGEDLKPSNPMMMAVHAALKAETFSDAVDALSDADWHDPDGGAIIVRGARICHTCDGDGALEGPLPHAPSLDLLDAAKWALRGLVGLAQHEARRRGGDATPESCDYTFAKGLRYAIAEAEGNEGAIWDEVIRLVQERVPEYHVRRGKKHPHCVDICGIQLRDHNTFYAKVSDLQETIRGLVGSWPTPMFIFLKDR